MQPVSIFIIHVNQGLTAAAPCLIPLDTAPATTLVTTTMNAPVTPVPVTSAPTTKAAGSVFLPCCAIGILGLFILARKH